MKKKILLAILGLLVIGALGAYFFVFNAQHRNIAEEEASFIVQADELQQPFTEGDASLYQKYIDQVVQVTGKITDISAKTVELDYKVEANMADSLKTALQTGASITLKGRCVGYDDLLELVRIDQATLIDNQ